MPNFTPERGEYIELKPFRMWCQKVLPLVYDDSLSYYEVLCKVLDYLNKAMEDTETLEEDVTNLYNAYEALQDWINQYYESEDFEQAINDGIDRLIESGQMEQWISADVAELINGVVANQIGDVVAAQIGGEVGRQIGTTVASQINTVVANQIGAPVTGWLNANMSGATNALDNTFYMANAAPISTMVRFLIEKILANNYVNGKYLLVDSNGHESDVSILRWSTDAPTSPNYDSRTYNTPVTFEDNIVNTVVSLTCPYTISGESGSHAYSAFPEFIPLTRNVYPDKTGYPGYLSEYLNEYKLSGFGNVKPGDRVKFKLVLDYDYNPDNYSDYQQDSQIPANDIELGILFINNLNQIVYEKIDDFPLNATMDGLRLVNHHLEGSIDYTIPVEYGNESQDIGFIVRVGEHVDGEVYRQSACWLVEGWRTSTGLENPIPETLTLTLSAEKINPKVIDVPDIPSSNGTYTLKLTKDNSGATYSWEQDEV